MVDFEYSLSFVVSVRAKILCRYCKKTFFKAYNGPLKDLLEKQVISCDFCYSFMCMYFNINQEVNMGLEGLDSGIVLPEEDYLDIEDFKVLEWLHFKWAPMFWGWSLCENQKTNQGAILFKVPPFYFVGDNKVYTNPEQEFCNMLRFVVKEQKATITFNFRKIPALIWDITTHPNFFKDNEHQLRRDISKDPNYFSLIEQLRLGSISVSRVKDIFNKATEQNICDPGIFEVWDLSDLEVSNLEVLEEKVEDVSNRT